MFFSFGCIIVFTIITYRYIITLEDDSYVLDTKLSPKLSNSLQFLFHNNFLGGLRPKISGSLEVYKFNKRVVSSLEFRLLLNLQSSNFSRVVGEERIEKYSHNQSHKFSFLWVRPKCKYHPSSLKSYYFIYRVS